MAELVNTSLDGDANLQAYYQLDDVNDDSGNGNTLKKMSIYCMVTWCCNAMDVNRVIKTEL